MTTRMKLLSGLGILGMLFLLSPTGARANVCPGPNGGSEDGEGIDAGYLAQALTGNTCNVLITFGAGGAITTTNPNTNGYYDTGADDNLVGIVNNSGATINSIVLSSTTQDIYGFDFDGICGGSTVGTSGYTFIGGGNPCAGATDPNGYGGPGVTFTNISANDMSGTVNFAGGLADGQSIWFSLEGPVGLSQGGSNPTVPEPATSALFGAGLVILSLMSKKLVSQN